MKIKCWDTRATDSIIESGQNTEASINKKPSGLVWCVRYAQISEVSHNEYKSIFSKEKKLIKNINKQTSFQIRGSWLTLLTSQLCTPATLEINAWKRSKLFVDRCIMKNLVLDGKVSFWDKAQWVLSQSSVVLPGCPSSCSILHVGLGAVEPPRTR